MYETIVYTRWLERFWRDSGHTYSTCKQVTCVYGQVHKCNTIVVTKALI